MELDKITHYHIHMTLVIFFLGVIVTFVLVFHCLLLSICLLFIVICALDMHLIKATCLLTHSLTNITHRCSFSADEDTEQRCRAGGYKHHPGVFEQCFSTFHQMATRLCSCYWFVYCHWPALRHKVNSQRLLSDRSRKLRCPRAVHMSRRCRQCRSSCNSHRCHCALRLLIPESCDTVCKYLACMLP